MTPKKKLYILDVSGFIFRAYFALPPMKDKQGGATHGLFGFIRSLLKFFKEFGPENVVAVFDGPDNKKQRLEIYEKYKANRIQKYDDLPAQIEEAKRFCHHVGISIVEVGGVEADDTIGSIATYAGAQGWDVYILTADKDLAQLVTENIFLINPWKENKVIDKAAVQEIYGVPPEKIADLLAIMGDSSDNIPGLSGFGPKTAVALLQEHGSLEEILLHPEKVKGEKKQQTLRDEADIARLSYRLATIYTTIDFPKESPLFPKSAANLADLKSFYLEKGFTSLVREMESLIPSESTEKVSYHLVDSEEALAALITDLRKAPSIAFDLETTDIRPLFAHAVGIGFCIRPQEAFYVPLNGPLQSGKVLSALKPLLESTTAYLFGHNVKYDLHVLRNMEITSQPRFDTILASYLLHPEGRRHSLDHLSLEYFGKVKTPITALIGSGKKQLSMDQVPIERVCNYCCEDADYTFRLKERLEKELEMRELTSLLMDLELPLSLVLLKMERAGIFVDVDALKALSSQFSRDLDRLREKIYLIAGETFNISSPKQLSDILFTKLGIKPLKKTQTGLSTNAEVLEELALTHEIAKEILEYRLLDKLCSTYLDALPEEVNPLTGRIHPTFSQVITATGRLSCQDPNLQNIPVRSMQGKKIRTAFKPQRPSWSFLAADYSQIELRLLAHLSGDERLIAAFHSGEDIHRYTASLMFDIPYDKITKEQRGAAKAINFGIIYGQQAFGLSRELKISTKEAAAFIDAYFARYPQVLSYIQHCIREAKSTGKSRTMIGRERQLPEINSDNAILRSAAERLAVNTPLQGSAADLIKLAMLKIDGLLTERGMSSFLILQIHDELVFEAPDKELNELSALVKEAMEGVFSLKVPLIVDIAIGKNWGEC